MLILNADTCNFNVQCTCILKNIYWTGLQEYIEAVSFYHYLKSKTLVSLEQVQSDLTFTVQSDDTEPSQEKTFSVHVPPSEYMLGLADLTGELMRFAINSVGSGNLDCPNDVCAYLRRMLGGFESLGQVSREMNRKIYTLRQSLQKVEAACYTLQIRGSEIPKHMLKDIFRSVPGAESSYMEERDLDEWMIITLFPFWCIFHYWEYMYWYTIQPFISCSLQK